MPKPAAKHPCDVHKVAAECLIRILKPEHHRAGGQPRRCFCPRKLKAIGQRHGEDHLRLVLRLIVESNGNAGSLQGDVIAAVSSVVLSGKVEVGSGLFGAFDAIDLAELRTWASAVRGTASLDAVLSSVLLWHLAPPRIVLPQESREAAARKVRNARLRAVRQRKGKLITVSP